MICNTSDESHWNERNPKIVHVCDCTIEDGLKELIGTIYIQKMHLFFDSQSLKNFIVKCAWLWGLRDVLPFGKFLGKHVNEKKAH